MTTATRAREPEEALVGERTAGRPVMLVSVDISFDESAIVTAIESAVQANSELLLCLAVTLPVGNANAAARRHMGNPAVREEMTAIMSRARAAGAKAQILIYNSPRPIKATIDVAKARELGLLVFGPHRKRYGRLRFRIDARRLRRKAGCLVWPLE